MSALSVFPTTTTSAEIGHDTPAPGTVLIGRGVTDTVEVTIRVAGVLLVGRVIKADPFNGQRRIIVRDLLNDINIVDMYLHESVAARPAFAIAEGIVRGYALALGVEVR